MKAQKDCLMLIFILSFLFFFEGIFIIIFAAVDVVNTAVEDKLAVVVDFSTPLFLEQKYCQNEKFNYLPS